ncbi:MAG TPA: hypothetical protein VMV46_05035 [Thermoanaerobaculia bacterium]|nr:hypothetical protein [Thermoanaerobaculia bacterium]
MADHFDLLQTFLDQQMALRKVDLDLVEVTKGSPHTRRFMLAATEGGRTVDVEVTRLRVVVENGTDLVDVLANAAITLDFSPV